MRNKFLHTLFLTLFFKIKGENITWNETTFKIDKLTSLNRLNETDALQNLTNAKIQKSNPCEDNPCKNGGTCQTKDNLSFTCLCKYPYSGKQCEKECECENGNCVSDSKGKLFCECFPEFGHYSPNHCRACNCGRGINCTYNDSLYSSVKTCKCPEEYQTQDQEGKCVDLCPRYGCQNGATCKYSKEKGFECLCRKPFWGVMCELDCDCENGYCVKDYSENSLGTIVCKCPPEFGHYSSNICKECECGDGANCTFNNGISSNETICICPKRLKDIDGKCVDPCISYDCKNGGTCEYYKDEKLLCKCKSPFWGMHCELDLCSINQCQNGGICRMDGKYFKCNCPKNFTGEFCENDICRDSSHCLNDGICKINSDRHIFCECENDFGGDRCEINLPCQRLEPTCESFGAICNYKNNSASCECPFNSIYNPESKFCVEICHENVCVHGECEASGICRCKVGYTGTSCEIELPLYNYQFTVNIVLLVLMSIGFIVVFLYFLTILFRLKKKKKINY